MTVKHGHDWLEGALRVVPEALLSREVILRDSLLSLVGKVDGKSAPQPDLLRLSSLAWPS
ncbi:BQ2448_1145 [Microbotryum intermedium]|uniref:BQ2448_1145 protein n=1 Tax=Microbotryum intermedium TaxID=269621 RepID=A0A238FCB6_9BASI|nr:BQ2448_1145 [Microbotryum intermedium]